MDIKFIYQNAHDALAKANRVLIVSHPKPDGDTLGAATAMLNFCRGKGIAVSAFCVDRVPEQYNFMVGTEHFGCDQAVWGDGSHDVVAVFDAGDLRYAGIVDFIPRLPVRPVILNFDHHATNERFGDINIVDTSASSTAEVVYRFLDFCGAEIDQPTATCLLTGILTDTSTFSNPATTSGSLEAASKLMRRGGKIQEVANRLLRNKSIAALRLWGTVLSRLKFNSSSGLASTAILAEDMDGVLEEDHIEGVANFLGNFLDAKIILVLREKQDGTVKGSFRTAEDIDVSVAAKLLGGGGHKKAAGFTISGQVVETDKGWRVADEIPINE